MPSFFQHKLGEVLPEVAKDIWVRQLLKGYQGERMVVSDLRFNHAAAALRQRVPDTYAYEESALPAAALFTSWCVVGNAA